MRPRQSRAARPGALRRLDLRLTAEKADGLADVDDAPHRATLRQPPFYDGRSKALGSALIGTTGSGAPVSSR